MTNLRAKLAAIFFGVAVFSNESFGCSWVYVIDESDERVTFVGIIAGYTREQIDGKPVFGVVVAPVLVYGSDNIPEVDAYSIFPYEVGGDCSPGYPAPSDALRDYYQVGKLVTVIGTHDSEAPGKIALAFGQELEVLPDECTVRAFDVEFRQASFREPACGSRLFHAYKDLASLRSATTDQISEIILRLSGAPIFTYFEKLVKRYVEDKEARHALIESQYGAVIDKGCSRSPEPVVGRTISSSQLRDRRRWYEYCTDERQEAANDGA